MTHVTISRGLEALAGGVFCGVFGDRRRPFLHAAGRWRFMARSLHLSSDADAMFATPVARRLGT
jgi:hypothetical protein